VIDWSAFSDAVPDFAAAGSRLLVGDDGVAIAFLATADERGSPHLAPICPIFCGPNLYLSAASGTPKISDLRQNGRYVLHAFLGASDEEFQLRGRAHEVSEERERAAVHEAIPFDAFDRTHPIFQFGFESAVWVSWERPGQPDTRAIRRRWPSRPAQ
jgi:hypothetical protein